MEQLDLIETAVARSLLDQLLDDSRLYKSGADYKQLLDFVVRLRNFAPFNAMLLQIQKPGLMYAASARDCLCSSCWESEEVGAVQPSTRSSRGESVGGRVVEGALRGVEDVLGGIYMASLHFAGLLATTLPAA